MVLWIFLVNLVKLGLELPNGILGILVGSGLWVGSLFLYWWIKHLARSTQGDSRRGVVCVPT